MKISTIILSSFLIISSLFAEKKLFDGISLKGWEGDPKFWSVQDGAILGQTTKENSDQREIPFSFGRMENWAILNSRLITKLKRETAEFSTAVLLNRESMTVGELVDIRLTWKQAISFLAYVMEKAFGEYSPCVV